MSDILGIASNAVAAYQRALSTTSNNIANVNTPGYTREVAHFEANPVTQVGSIFMGTGASVDKITRQYNAFMEANLRNSNSDLSSQAPMVDYANRVVDIMGGESTSLNSQLDQFFTSARTLSADPASTVLRSSFMRDAQGIADRFGQLSGQLESIQSETTQALQGEVDQVNSLTKQLALVNFQLNKQRLADSQPAGLMDQRDQLLLKISDFAHVNTKFEINGVVTVSLGPSITQDIVVSGNDSTEIGANFNAAAPEKVALVLDPFGKSVALNGPTSGSIAGMMAFREQVLGNSHSALDNLAKTFVNAVNEIHQGGIDGYGRPADALFRFDPSAPTLAAGMQVAIDDPMRVSAAAQFRVIKKDTNTSTADPKLVYDPRTYSGATTPGSAPGVRADDVTKLFDNNSNTAAGRLVTVSSQVPVRQIASVAGGLNDVSFFLDSAQVGQQLSILTRDGRAVVGGSLSQSAQDAVFAPGNGFVAGATYSDAYLNKSGVPDGYRDMKVFYGAQAEVMPEPLYNEKDQVTGFNAVAPVLQGSRIQTGQTSIDANAFVLNGIALGGLTAGANSTLQAKDLAAWINQKTFVKSDVFTSNAIKVNAETVPGINASNSTRVSIGLMNKANGSGVQLADGTALTSLDLGGRVIAVGNSGWDLNRLVKAINDSSPPNVVASISQSYVQPEVLMAGVLVNGSNVAATDGMNVAIPFVGDPTGGGETATKLAGVDFSLATLKIGSKTFNTQGLNSLNAFVDRINASTPSTNVVASITDGRLVLSPALATGPFLVLQPKPLTGVVATARNEIRATQGQMNLNMPLRINNVDIVTVGLGSQQQPTIKNVYDLVDTLNAKSALTGVTASVNERGDLLLTNAAGHEGEDITLNPTTFGGTPANALGLTSGTYGGTLSLTQPVSAANFVDPLALTKPVLINNAPYTTDPLDSNKISIAVTTTDGDSMPKIGGVAVRGMPLSIAGQPINTNDVTTLRGLIAEINHNTAITHVSASVSPQGKLVLTPAVAYKPLQMTFGTSGSPRELGAIGFRTQATISGVNPDDMLVFVTGSGSASVAASYAGKPTDPRVSLRAQTLLVNFDSATHYTITDTATGTVVASRNFDPAKLDPAVDYQGLQLTMTTPPAAGDAFTMDGNQDGLGNNDNMIAIAALETKRLVGNKTLSGAYIDQVNEMGNISRQAKTAQTALTVVHDQAVESRDQLSGVSLDAEAADLIRFQQAYQAAAKVIQISGTLFDAIVGIR
jgi:flagellar hook-associated protein FlgK